MGRPKGSKNKKKAHVVRTPKDGQPSGEQPERSVIRLAIDRRWNGRPMRNFGGGNWGT